MIGFSWVASPEVWLILLLAAVGTVAHHIAFNWARKKTTGNKAFDDWRCECGAPLSRGKCPNCD